MTIQLFFQLTCTTFSFYSHKIIFSLANLVENVVFKVHFNFYISKNSLTETIFQMLPYLTERNKQEDQLRPSEVLNISKFCVYIKVYVILLNNTYYLYRRIGV